MNSYPFYSLRRPPAPAVGRLSRSKWLLASVGAAMLLLVRTPDMLAQWILVGSILVFIALCRELEFRRREFVSLESLFLAVFALYALLPFVLMALCGRTDFLDVEVPTYYMDDSAFNTATLLCVLSSVLGLYAGLISKSKTVRPLDLKMDGEWDGRESGVVAAAIIFVGATLLWVLVQKVGLSTYLGTEYVQVYQAEAGLGIYAAGVYVLPLGFLLLLLRDADRMKAVVVPIVPLVFLAIYALAVFRIGRRRYVLEVGIAALLIAHYYLRRVKIRELVAAMLVLLLIFGVIGQARALMAQGFEGMYFEARERFGPDTILHSIDDTQVVPLTVSETAALVPSLQPFKFGLSYLEAFEVLVPVSLYPTRPLASGQWFVWAYDPLTAARGGGYSYSMIAEGYLNFGYLGPFIVYFFIGRLLRGMEEFRRRAPQSKSRMLVYAIASVLLISLLRGDAAGLLKTFVGVYVPALLAARWLGRRAPLLAATTVSAPGSAPRQETVKV